MYLMKSIKFTFYVLNLIFQSVKFTFYVLNFIL